MWMGTLPTGWIARNYGRRACPSGRHRFRRADRADLLRRRPHGSFLLFNIAAFFSGLYASAHQSYRFAAADTATDAFRPKAISWVMVGGIFAGIMSARSS